MSEPDGYGLAMPFVTVASVGGPHDDSGYVHGFEMGQLIATLPAKIPHSFATTFHAENLPQADLIAMRNGYRMEPVTSGDGWVEVEFIYTAEESA